MLTKPMMKMLALLAAGFSAHTAMHGVRNAGATLNALVARGMVALVPVGADPRVVKARITGLGQDTAFRALLVI